MVHTVLQKRNAWPQCHTRSTIDRFDRYINYIIKKIAVEEDRFLILGMHPGLVTSDMGTKALTE